MNSTPLYLERVSSSTHPLYESAIDLYRMSFPTHEQREPESQRAIMAHPNYHFNLIFEGDTFIGLLLCWETKEFIYVEHFCIHPEKRNNNYGGRTLELLTHKGKNVILEIDPPVDKISIRRKGFYERAGFMKNDCPHIHPPYHEGHTGHKLVVMSFPTKISAQEYEDFNNYLCNVVMDSL